MMKIFGLAEYENLRMDSRRFTQAAASIWSVISLKYAPLTVPAMRRKAMKCRYTSGSRCLTGDRCNSRLLAVEDCKQK